MKITDEYNNNQMLMKNVAKVDYTSLVINNIWTKVCVVEHQSYRTAVVSHGTVTFIMSLSFRYDRFAPLVYNVTRRTGDAVFEEMLGTAVMGSVVPPNRLFDPMYAMRAKHSGNDSRIKSIVSANEGTGVENVIEVILTKLDDFYLGDSNEWIEIQHVIK